MRAGSRRRPNTKKSHSSSTRQRRAAALIGAAGVVELEWWVRPAGPRVDRRSKPLDSVARQLPVHDESASKPCHVQAGCVGGCGRQLAARASRPCAWALNRRQRAPEQLACMPCHPSAARLAVAFTRQPSCDQCTTARPRPDQRAAARPHHPSRCATLFSWPGERVRLGQKRETAQESVNNPKIKNK